MTLSLSWETGKRDGTKILPFIFAVKKYADVLLDLAAERLVIYPFSILLLISFLFWHVTAVGLQPSRINPDRLSYFIQSLHAHFISLVAAAIKPTNRLNT